MILRQLLFLGYHNFHALALETASTASAAGWSRPVGAATGGDDRDLGHLDAGAGDAAGRGVRAGSGRPAPPEHQARGRDESQVSTLPFHVTSLVVGEPSS